MQEVKPKPGDLKPKILENMALVATKQKPAIEKALNNFMEISANEVRKYGPVVSSLQKPEYRISHN